MRIAILGTRPNGSMDELTLAAADHEVEFVRWSSLEAEVGKTEQAGVRNRTFDAILVRGMPIGTLEQIIFQMNLLARWQATGTTVVNSPRSLEIAIDKYLTLALIREAGLPVPETRVCQSVDAAIEAFESLGGDVVLKPVFGGEGRGLIRLTDVEMVHRAIRAVLNLGGIVYAQEFIQHAGADIRLLVLGDIVLGMKRENSSDWRTNASRGATCTTHAPADHEVELAVAAARATGSTIAGVDLVYNEALQPFVLEVNGVPGWRQLARVSGIDVAAKVIELLVAATPVAASLRDAV